MEAHMSGKLFDLDDFFARPVTLTLKRVLIVDYLFAHGFLPCDLKNLPPGQAAVLFEEACRFARRNLDRIEPQIVFSHYVLAEFSRN